MIAVALVSVTPVALALDNGLCITPPMGYNVRSSRKTTNAAWHGSPLFLHGHDRDGKGSHHVVTVLPCAPLRHDLPFAWTRATWARLRLRPLPSSSSRAAWSTPVVRSPSLIGVCSVKARSVGPPTYLLGATSADNWRHMPCSDLDAIVDEFVNSDEGWEEKHRDNTTGRIVPTAAFGGPDGIKAFVQSIHAMGLKLGLYGAASVRPLPRAASCSLALSLPSCGDHPSLSPPPFH